MNKHYLRAAAVMLRRYSDEVGHHSCNDFDLADAGFPSESWEPFVKLANDINRSPHEHTPGRDPEKYREVLPDFQVADVLAHLLEEAAAKETT